MFVFCLRGQPHLFQNDDDGRGYAIDVIVFVDINR